MIFVFFVYFREICLLRIFNMFGVGGFRVPSHFLSFLLCLCVFGFCVAFGFRRFRVRWGVRAPPHLTLPFLLFFFFFGFGFGGFGSLGWGEVARRATLPRLTLLRVFVLVLSLCLSVFWLFWGVLSKMAFSPWKTGHLRRTPRKVLLFLWLMLIYF